MAVCVMLQLSLEAVGACRAKQAALWVSFPCFMLRLRCPVQHLSLAHLQVLPAFREPDLRWWQRRKVVAADAAALAELSVAEARLTVEQVAHFRCAASYPESARLAALGSQQSWHEHIADCRILRGVVQWWI